MHSTDHKAAACSLEPWKRRSATRVCQHGDSAFLARQKAKSRQARRQTDKREARDR